MLMLFAIYDSFSFRYAAISLDATLSAVTFSLFRFDYATLFRDDVFFAILIFHAFAYGCCYFTYLLLLFAFDIFFRYAYAAYAIAVTYIPLPLCHA